MERYKRQIILPEITEDGQRKLLHSSILCVGAGGLGSPALLYLAAAGIGKIGIIDFDKVDESNLQRQIIFQQIDVGKFKAQSAAERLSNLNPDITVEFYNQELNEKNIIPIFEQYDLIIDGTDNFSSKYLINDACIKIEKTWIYGAIQGFDGQASVFNPKNGFCYRCLFPDPPKAKIQNCAEAGVIGAIAGLIGVTQALQAIEILINHESFSPLLGKLWVINAKNMEAKTLNIPSRINCLCKESEKKNIELNYQSPICDFIPEISVLDIKNINEFILIDVREKYEWDAGHIDESINIPLSVISEKSEIDISKDKNIIMVCQMGGRSQTAAQIFKTRGYNNIYNLKGGYNEWLKRRD